MSAVGRILPPFVVTRIGFASPCYIYILQSGTSRVVAAPFSGLYKFSSTNGTSTSSTTSCSFARVLAARALLWKGGDGGIIDGLGPDGVAAAHRGCHARRGRLQPGYVYHYAFAMLIGVVAFVTWYFVIVGIAP